VSSPDVSVSFVASVSAAPEPALLLVPALVPSVDDPGMYIGLLGAPATGSETTAPPGAPPPFCDPGTSVPYCVGSKLVGSPPCVPETASAFPGTYPGVGVAVCGYDGWFASGGGPPATG
jgi:hypothetical protein